MIIKSQIIPLPRKDIDTDLIIPADFLKGTGKEGLGQHLFARLRSQEPDFPLNLDRYKSGKILLVQENFGCGSSREHAAWALKDWGIDVVVAPSFSDIFHSNAFKNGLLPIVLDSELVETIFEKESASDKFIVEVDLPEQRIVLPGNEIYEFEIDPYRKYCLVNQMSDFDYLFESIDEIRRYEKAHDKKLFFDISRI